MAFQTELLAYQEPIRLIENEYCIKMIDDTLNDLRESLRVVRSRRCVVRKRKRQHRGQTQLRGKRCMEKIRETLKHFRIFNPSTGNLEPIEYSEDQNRMINFFLQRSIPAIYGHEWSKRRMAVIEEQKITVELGDIGFTRAPRQIGKTTVLAAFSASVAFNKPGITMNIYSLGKRSANNLLDAIYRFIKTASNNLNRRLCGMSDGVIYISAVPLPSGKTYQSQAAKTLCKHQKTSRITAFPGGVNSLRGPSCDIALFDEIEFMDPKTITHVVMPLLGHEERVALGVSTPGDDGNIISDLTEKKNADGKPLFQLLDLGLACPECVEEGKAAECTHRKKTLPPWKSRKKLKRMSALIPDAAVNAKENLGVAASSKNLLFKRKEANAFLAREVRPVENASIIYIGLDPAGGSDGSDFTIMSMIKTWTHDIIIGCDRTDSADSQVVSDLIVTHVHSLLQREYAHNARFVFIPESNMSFINSDAYAVAIRGIVGANRFTCMRLKSGSDSIKRVKRGNRMGVWTGPTQKAMFVVKMRQSLESEKLCYDPDGFGKDFKGTMKEMKDQLCRFHRTSNVKDGDTPNSRSFKYTGKLPGGKKDDIVITTMLILFWSEVYIKEQKQLSFEF